VANSPPDDAQLEQLLTQLLKLVSPAFAADNTETAGYGGKPPGEPRPGDPGAAVLAAAPTEAYALPDAGGASHPGQAGNGAKLPSVSASEARALIELMSARGIAQGELAGLLGLDKSTVSRLATGLERKGWIRRGRDEDNQRYVRLHLTAEGGDIAGRVVRAWHSRQARILAALSEDERAGLSAGLRGLVRGLAAEGLLSESRAHNGRAS
jgi:DNA-binding MarR family transcriptional regulator